MGLQKYDTEIMILIPVIFIFIRYKFMSQAESINLQYIATEVVKTFMSRVQFLN